MRKEIIGNSVLLAGFGREGKSTLKYIKKHYPDVLVSVADSNPDLPISLHDVEAVYRGPDYLATISDFDTVIRSPGIPCDLPEFKNANNVTSAMNIFFSECPGLVIGITGTKGKSTTTSLIHHILSQDREDVRLVGNIGIPALDLLDNAKSDTVFVTELSSYQLDDIKYSPHIAVVLAISQEHLSYHGSLDKYVKAKSNIVKYQNQNDFVIYSSNNQNAKTIALNSVGSRIENGNPSSIPVAAWNQNNFIWIKEKNQTQQKLVELSKLPLIGKANVINTTAAVLVSLLCDVEPETVRSAIETFKPLEHRLEPVGTYKGISFYNDSLATTPDAAINAVDAFGANVDTLIAGGYDRGLDYSNLGTYIAKSSIRNLLLFPDTGKLIEQSLLKADKDTKVKIMSVNNMENAVKAAYQMTKPGSTCLMSPAAASFNLFKDYADRGNQFKKWVRYFGNIPESS